MIIYEPGFTNYKYPKTIEIKIYTYANLEMIQESFLSNLNNTTINIIEEYKQLTSFASASSILLNTTSKNYM